jgi:16S rRNA (uracil1498-N3)-methyltransferase
MRFYLEDFSRPVLNETESGHAIRVLRLRAGSRIEVLDGAGHFARATITRADSRAVELVLEDVETRAPHWRGEIWMGIAPTKNSDRMEWLVEKSAEIGLNGFIFLRTERTERTNLNTGRLRKVALAAIKQSGQPFLPVMEEGKTVSSLFQRFDDVVLTDTEEEETAVKWKRNLQGKTLLLIGPEGDFTPEEKKAIRQAGATSLSLSPCVLRTETAGLYSLFLAHQ